MTTISLYQIEKDYLYIIDALENSMSEEISEQEINEANQLLEINQADFQEKARAYAFVIRNEEASLEAIENEIKRLTALKKSKQGKIDSLKTRISNAMQLFGFDKIDLGLFKLSFRKSQSVQIEEGAIIPDALTKVVVSPDKTALKNAIKSGEVIPGVSIVESKNLQIK